MCVWDWNCITCGIWTIKKMTPDIPETATFLPLLQHIFEEIVLWRHQRQSLEALRCREGAVIVFCSMKRFKKNFEYVDNFTSNMMKIQRPCMGTLTMLHCPIQWRQVSATLVSSRRGNKAEGWVLIMEQGGYSWAKLFSCCLNEDSWKHGFLWRGILFNFRDNFEGEGNPNFLLSLTRRSSKHYGILLLSTEPQSRGEGSELEISVGLQTIFMFTFRAEDLSSSPSLTCLPHHKLVTETETVLLKVLNSAC